MNILIFFLYMSNTITVTLVRGTKYTGTYNMNTSIFESENTNTTAGSKAHTHTYTPIPNKKKILTLLI